MSRPYVNGSFAQQGKATQKKQDHLLVALLAVLCLVGVIAAAIASQGERDPVEMKRCHPAPHSRLLVWPSLRRKGS